MAELLVCAFAPRSKLWQFTILLLLRFSPRPEWRSVHTISAIHRSVLLESQKMIKKAGKTKGRENELAELCEPNEPIFFRKIIFHRFLPAFR